MSNLIRIYFIVMNVISFLIMGIDKEFAKKGMWRIPEKTLFLFPLLGGGVGGTLGMYLFHHKTKHWYFKYGFPVLAFLWMILVYIGKSIGI